MKTKRSTVWRGFAFLAPALLAGAVVYFNAMSGEFVYDDNEQIVKNPWVHELRYLPRVVSQPVWAYQTTEPTNYYRPVQMGIYNLLWGAFGKNPLPFHLASLLFHLLCTGVLFFLVETVSRDPAAAGAAALLFAVHPLSTEAVAWIACLPELSYAFFVLAALLLHVHSRTGPWRRRVLLRVLAVAAFLLGMLSKESAIALLPLLLFVEIWLPRETISRVDASAPLSSRSGRGRVPSFRPTLAAMRPVLPYVAATFGYLALRLSVLGGIAPRSQMDRNAIDALLNAPVLFLGYLRAMVAPTRLLAFHILEPVTSFLSPRFLGGLAGAALVALVVFRLSRRRPDLGLAGILIIAPLLPVLYIPAVGENAFAERYAYLPTAGMAWMIAGGLAGLVGAVPRFRGRAAWPVVLALLALPCAVRTVARNADWHDDRRLASSTLEQEPQAWHMHVVLADWYFRRDRLEESLDAFEKGLAAFPANPVLQLGVTSVRLQLRRIRPEAAIQDYRRLVASYPRFYTAEYGLGNAYLKIDRPAEAEAAFRQAIVINPMALEAHEGLFVALVAQGRSVDWSAARNKLPNAPALRGMDKLLQGVAEEKAGRLEEAEASLQEALRLDPKSDRALLSLAVVQDRRGRYALAMDYCRQAIALNPRSVEAYEQLGVSALNLGSLEEAVESLEKAVSLDPKDKEALNRLGVAYARAGKAPEAQAAFEKALGLDPAFEKARFNLERLQRGRGAASGP